MRLAYVSDLHTDLSARNFELLAHLANALHRDPPDVFVIAGDLAERVDDVERSLGVFADAPCERVYLAGNHDLFFEGAAHSREKFEVLLPAAAARAGFRYLGLEPLQLGAFTFVGVPGWYDFTLRDPALASVADTEAYRTGQWRGHRAYDRGHLLWPSTAGTPAPGALPARAAGGWAGDEEIAAHMLERLEAQLSAAGDAQHLVAVIHVLAFEELVQRGAFGVNGFYDAYLGSARLGARLAREPRVRVLVSGHLHGTGDRRIGNIRAVTRALGDARKHDGPLEALAARILGRLDIDARAAHPAL